MRVLPLNNGSVRKVCCCNTMSCTRWTTFFDKWNKHPIWFNALSMLDSRSVMKLWGIPLCVSCCTSTCVALLLFSNSSYAPTIIQWFVDPGAVYSYINWSGVDLNVPSKNQSCELLRKRKPSSVPYRIMQFGRLLLYTRNCWPKTV